MRSLLATTLAGWCVALAACGGSAPSRQATSRSKLQQAQARHEYPSATTPTQTTSGGALTPLQAIRAFASAYINWTADTVAGDMRALAAQSVGQARSALELAAAQTGQDYELQRGGIANSGVVEAIAPLLTGRHDEYVVVTRELTTATNTSAYQGLRPAWHLALASVVELTPGQWVVSRWQPEN
jgi:hypothetical protein